MIQTKSMINVLILGRANTGKSSLVSVLSNPERNEGFYFEDKEFEFINIRITSDSVSFIDTLSWSSNINDNAEYITNLRTYLRENNISINMIIICLQNNRLKHADKDIVRLINNTFVNAKKVIYISHRQEEITKNFKLEIFKGIPITFGNLISSGEFDEDSNTYIINKEECYNVRRRIYTLLHDYFGLVI